MIKYWKNRVHILLWMICVCVCFSACGKSEPTESVDKVVEDTQDVDSAETKVPEDMEVSNPQTKEDSEEVEQVTIPVFSAEAGFYPDEFELTIGAGKGQEIYYTLDGSDPTDSDTAKVYDKALRMRRVISEYLEEVLKEYTKVCG